MKTVVSRELVVRGTAEERARQQAAASGPLLEDAVRAFSGLPFVPQMPGRARRALVRTVLHGLGGVYLRRHRPALARHAGGKYWSALQALAGGFGVSPSYAYGFGAFEVVASKMSFGLGCSSLAFAAGSTSVDRPILAYNHDFPPAFAPFARVRRNLPSDGHASLSLSYPILLGAIGGVNAAGLAVSLNHAWITEFPRKPAVPITMLVQDALDRCASVDEAVALFLDTPVPNGSMVTLVDAAGNRAAVELAPTLKRVRKTDGPILHTFNHYLDPDMQRIEVPQGAIGTGTIKGMDIHGPNVARQRRFDALRPELPARLGPADLDRLMADHDDGAGSSNTLCRHADPLSETIVSAILDPVGRSLRVAFGHACNTARQVFELEPEGRATLAA